MTFAKELFAEWREVGLFILPVGELESWWPEGPAGNKAEWIAQAVELLDQDDSLPELETFVCELAGFFAEVHDGSPTGPNP